MPKPVVKGITPPSELTDRSEGWGVLGRIPGYPAYKDDGIWADTFERRDEFEKWPTEVYDGFYPETDWYITHRMLAETYVEYLIQNIETGEIRSVIELLNNATTVS